MAILNRTISRTEAKLPVTSFKLGPWLLALGAVIAVVAVLQLMQTSRATTTSFKITQMEQQKLELETSVSQLNVQVAQLSSLARIQQEAKRLGLGPPAARETVEVSVPGPSGDSSMLPARLLPTNQTTAKAGEPKPSWWESLLKRLPFH
jgi:cell division protein FtsL